MLIGTHYIIFRREQRKKNNDLAKKKVNSTSEAQTILIRGQMRGENWRVGQSCSQLADGNNFKLTTNQQMITWKALAATRRRKVSHQADLRPKTEIVDKHNSKTILNLFGKAPTDRRMAFSRKVVNERLECNTCSFKGCIYLRICKRRLRQ